MFNSAESSRNDSIGPFNQNVQCSRFVAHHTVKGVEDWEEQIVTILLPSLFHELSVVYLFHGFDIEFIPFFELFWMVIGSFGGYAFTVWRLIFDLAVFCGEKFQNRFSWCFG